MYHFGPGNLNEKLCIFDVVFPPRIFCFILRDIFLFDFSKFGCINCHHVYAYLYFSPVGIEQHIYYSALNNKNKPCMLRVNLPVTIDPRYFSHFSVRTLKYLVTYANTYIPPNKRAITVCLSTFPSATDSKYDNQPS